MIIDLFLGFLKVGCFSFGGAYAAIPLIRDVVLAKGWITDEILSNMIAVAESTPGPVMVNLATYIGAEKAGIPGAAIATLAVILPAFIIILLIMAAFRALLKQPAFRSVLRALTACVIGVIFATGLTMVLNNCVTGEAGFDPTALILTAVLAAALWLPRILKMKKKISPILLIGISAILGILFR